MHDTLPPSHLSLSTASFGKEIYFGTNERGDDFENPVWREQKNYQRCDCHKLSCDTCKRAVDYWFTQQLHNFLLKRAKPFALVQLQILAPIVNGDALLKRISADTTQLLQKWLPFQEPYFGMVDAIPRKLSHWNICLYLVTRPISKPEQQQMKLSLGPMGQIMAENFNDLSEVPAAQRSQSAFLPRQFGLRSGMIEWLILTHGINTEERYLIYLNGGNQEDRLIFHNTPCIDGNIIQPI